MPKQIILARDFVVKRFIDQPWNSSLMQRKFTLSEKMYSICPSSSLKVVVLWKKGRWESALFVTAEKQADVTYYTNGVPN